MYNHDYNIPDIDDYWSEVKKGYKLSVLQSATWIRSTNITSNPPPLTFKEK